MRATQAARSINRSAGNERYQGNNEIRDGEDDSEGFVGS